MMFIQTPCFIHNYSDRRLSVIRMFREKNELVTASKIGISVVGTSEIYSHMHDPNAMILQFLLGTYAYGVDRMKDGRNILIYDMIFTLTVALLSNSDTYWYIPLLFLTKYYKYYKKHLGVFKPGFVGVMWSLACVMLPYATSGTHDTKYMCWQLLNCHLVNYGVSNFLDIKDIDDDRENNIMTIPVVYSKDISNLITRCCVVLSIIGLLFEIYFHKKI